MAQMQSAIQRPYTVMGRYVNATHLMATKLNLLLIRLKFKKNLVYVCYNR